MESAESVQNRAVQNAGTLLTIDDIANGGPVKYDAMVLYAAANQAFVDELAEKMKIKGLRLFTGFRNRLVSNQMPQDLVCELIASRCHNIILIYSPEFFNAGDVPEDAGKRAEAETQDAEIQFYATYTLATKIASKGEHRMIPCEYKKCTLPKSHRQNHRLYVKSEAYDFYEKLANILKKPRPRPYLPITASVTADSRSPDQGKSSRLSVVQRIRLWCRNVSRRFKEASSFKACLHFD
ncbi:uncharacterized protein LOC133521042 [Cydia pomonella]|uniref:uncharacterized protein LOC133521042 n=1 Tax=Cydia pomonella TaxID=82600 RepID=UPI002ADD4C95|nr:uncharacterized protein LOC133521042 [Cydia pomonella]